MSNEASHTDSINITDNTAHQTPGTMSLFDDQVLKFARYKAHEIWPKAKANEVTVKRETEGANVVWWITWKKKEDDIRVLRIPKTDSDSGAYKGEFRLPHRVEFDLSNNNLLGSPYFIRDKENSWSRWAGILVKDTFQLDHEFTQAERCELARQLGFFYDGLLVSSKGSESAGGRIYNQDKHGKQTCQHQSFHDNAPIPAKSGSSAYDIIADNLRFLKSKSAADDAQLSGLYGELLGVAEGINKYGCLSGKKFCFFDPEHLLPGNINVNKHFVKGTEERAIMMTIRVSPSSKAVIAPDFMAATPPYWLWNPDKMKCPSLFDLSEFENWDPTPRAKDLIELKNKFEAAAGKEYERLAWPDEYKIARRLAFFALIDDPEARNKLGMRDLVERYKIFCKEKEQWTDAERSARKEKAEQQTRVSAEWTTIVESSRSSRSSRGRGSGRG
ncbi:hypothetical protein GE09DRAFT_1259450 [Coniochaeta sp. 2T2.1]|nr:hypothetical protein GE09DRAFT_1259450 [Coniochaeta sp. 2T2.1]